MTTYTKILYQIVFGSKRRKDFFSTINQDELFAYLGGISKNKKCYPYKIGGYRNHIHMIVSLHKTQALSGFVQEVKKASHEWIISQPALFTGFPGWQTGYSGFTYDYSALKNLVNYVQNQETHHKKISFEDEYISLLEEHEIEYDLKYLWE